MGGQALLHITLCFCCLSSSTTGFGLLARFLVLHHTTGDTRRCVTVQTQLWKKHRESP
ncbi:hypothetical protein GE21DRAFT_1278174 [Neurospora crassa]|nr:hypothetical protein GE21DRAFT_1278174 [Neurospora crassa]